MRHFGLGDTRLPDAYSADRLSLNDYAVDLVQFLTTSLPSSLLHSHPNNVARDDFIVPDSWSSWWDWAAISSSESPYKSLLRAAYGSQEFCPHVLPAELSALVFQIISLQLPRSWSPTSSSNESIASAYLMKQKKAHEVSEMTSYLFHLSKAIGVDCGVDIGSGQGYLTRALASHPCHMHMLGLEGESSQLTGGQTKSDRRSRQKKKEPKVSDNSKSDLGSNGSLTFQNLYIGSETAVATSVSRWIAERSEQSPQPVILIGLHACGSLTPTIIRTYLKNRLPGEQNWYATGLVSVGCCYHLMDKQDFPMSAAVATQTDRFGFDLSHDHCMLAVQVPGQWLPNQSSTQFSLRKLTYRAMLSRLVARTEKAAFSTEGPRQRIYKIPDKCYGSFESYVRAASEKLCDDKIDFDRVTSVLLSARALDSEEDEKKLLTRLEVLHTLRSMLGTVVESLILVDRYLCLLEGSGENQGEHVGLIGLFDQAQGSGRNMALVAAMQR